MKSKKKIKELSGLSRRFLMAIDIVGYTRNQLILEMDVLTYQILNHVVTGRNDPSMKVVTAFLEKFPTINARWLLTGMGTPQYNGNSAVEDKDPTSVLHGISAEDIFTYIHNYKELRKFTEHKLYKGLMKLHVQDQIKEVLKGLEEEIERALKNIDSR
ncbi:MAG: hypothetical protein AAF934_07770 [Bacteroidota bacterium]